MIHTPEMYLQNVSINYPANHINTVDTFKDVRMRQLTGIFLNTKCQCAINSVGSAKSLVLC